VTQTPHERIHRRTASGLRGILFQPFAKGRIQRLMLRTSYKPGLFDQVFIGAEGNVFHTLPVYTIFVHLMFIPKLPGLCSLIVAGDGDDSIAVMIIEKISEDFLADQELGVPSAEPPLGLREGQRNLGQLREAGIFHGSFCHGCLLELFIQFRRNFRVPVSNKLPDRK